MPSGENNSAVKRLRTASHDAPSALAAKRPRTEFLSASRSSPNDSSCDCVTKSWVDAFEECWLTLLPFFGDGKGLYNVMRVCKRFYGLCFVRDGCIDKLRIWHVDASSSRTLPAQRVPNIYWEDVRTLHFRVAYQNMVVAQIVLPSCKSLETLRVVTAGDLDGVTFSKRIPAHEQDKLLHTFSGALRSLKSLRKFSFDASRISESKQNIQTFGRLLELAKELVAASRNLDVLEVFGVHDHGQAFGLLCDFLRTLQGSQVSTLKLKVFTDHTARRWESLVTVWESLASSSLSNICSLMVDLTYTGIWPLPVDAAVESRVEHTSSRKGMRAMANYVSTLHKLRELSVCPIDLRYLDWVPTQELERFETTLYVPDRSDAPHWEPQSEYLLEKLITLGKTLPETCDRKLRTPEHIVALPMELEQFNSRRNYTYGMRGFEWGDVPRDLDRENARDAAFLVWRAADKRFGLRRNVGIERMQERIPKLTWIRASEAIDDLTRLCTLFRGAEHDVLIFGGEWDPFAEDEGERAENEGNVNVIVDDDDDLDDL